MKQEPKKEKLVYNRNPKLPPRGTRPTVDMSSRMSTRRDTISVPPGRRQSYVVKDVGGRPTLVFEDMDDDDYSETTAAELTNNATR